MAAALGGQERGRLVRGVMHRGKNVAGAIAVEARAEDVAISAEFCGVRSADPAVARNGPVRYTLLFA